MENNPNVMDNGHSSLSDRVRCVKNRQSGSMALRWTAVPFDDVSEGFPRIMGYKHLWMLKAALDESAKDRSLVEEAKAGYFQFILGSPTPLSSKLGA
ncbi:MAG: hypothetical protein SFX72_11345 [Isosphaeraceae bacterium]|nr:hypothetical protein [Isosphaeraceae bacterium]